MSTKLQIETIDNPPEYFTGHQQEVARVWSAAFGSDNQALNRVAIRFNRARHGQILVAEDGPIGFALYNTIGEETLWLGGIAIDRSYRRRQLGAQLVRQTLEERSGYRALAAATRNPAIIHLVGSVASGPSCPDLTLPDPLQYLEHPRIAAVLDAYTTTFNSAMPERPYSFGRYPDDLYAVDPGRKLREYLPTISERPDAAVIVVGIL